MGLNVSADLSFGVLLPTHKWDVVEVARRLGIDVEGYAKPVWGDVLEVFEQAPYGLHVVYCGSDAETGYVLAAKTFHQNNAVSWSVIVDLEDLEVPAERRAALRRALEVLGVAEEPAWELTVMRWGL